MRISVHAGHNPDGMIACGAVGYIKESTAARLIKDEIVSLINRSSIDTAVDITVNDGKSQNNILARLVKSMNTGGYDLNVSIHLNSYKKEESDGQTKGVECYYFPGDKEAEKIAKNICSEIAANGYRNRGIKDGSGLYVIKHSEKSTILVECCFCDDPDDVAIFDASTMAHAIVKGILGKVPDEKPYLNDLNTEEEKPLESAISNGSFYRVQVGAFSNKENAIKLQKELNKAGFNAIITR